MSMDPSTVTAADLQHIHEQVLKAMKAHPTPWGVTFGAEGRVYDSDGEGVAIVGDPAVAYLLVYAPGNLAALVAEVERLRAEGDRLYDQLQVLDSRCNNAVNEVLHLKRCVAERDEDLARQRGADLALRASVEALMTDLWADDLIPHDHPVHERLLALWDDGEE